MRLLALSDLHVNAGNNLAAVKALPDRPADWLILAGDIGDTVEQLSAALDAVVPKVSQVIWVPGNHELWAIGDGAPRGVARYEALVAACRTRGVLTPEDPWPLWPGGGREGGPLRLCPLFLLYDYSFAPDGMDPEQAVAWAATMNVRATDEVLLHPDPYPSRQAWCAARVASTARRLAELDPGERTVLINHWPLRRDLVRFKRIEGFVPWCGTRLTEDWHVRYRAEVVVSGHLHMRATDWRDGVRFEEVSLGYPKHWRSEKGAGAYVREILPGPEETVEGDAGPVWRF